MGWKSCEPQGGIRWEQCLPIPDHTWVIDTKMANLSLGSVSLWPMEWKVHVRIDENILP